MAMTRERDEQADAQFMLEAYVGDATFAARLTAEFLDRWTKSLRIKTPISLPAEFLTELSAIIRISQWQQAGLDSHMQADFPPWKELLRQLFERLAEDPSGFSDDPDRCPAPLARRVMRLWFERCSWTAPIVLGVDVVVSRPDPQVLFDALAELLWQGRHLVSSKGESNA